MKRIKRTAALILAIITALAAPFSAYASFTTGSIFTSSTYTHQERFRGYSITQGVDVSNHNVQTYKNNTQVYDIDWNKVKAAGVKWAIVRIGCRGYLQAGTLMEDKFYKENIEGAYKAGIDVGVYFYSQALNKAEAKAEADYVLARINNYKSKITLPVYYDYEFAGTSRGRLDSAWNSGSITKKTMTNNAKVFCNTVEAAGFTAGVYASKSFFEDNLVYTDIQDKYDIWLAHYTTNTGYKGDFSLWQFSSKGTVNGINGYVDSNFMYSPNTFDDVAIPSQAYTGNEIVPDFDISYKGTKLRLGVDYYITITDNVEYGTAEITATGVNSYSSLKPKTFSFDIVPTAADGLTLTKRVGTSVALKWNTHPEADCYQIVCYGPDGKRVAGETAETSFTVTGLKGATLYNFAVCACKKLNSRTYCGIESEKLTAVTKPVKVKGVKTSARTKNSVTLKWTAQTGVQGYQVYKQNAETGKYELYGETRRNSFTALKLKPNTAYKFKIRASALTEKQLTVYGAFSKVYTAYSAPKTPKLKSAKSYSPKTITVTWKGVAGATGYQVQWSTSSAFTSNKKSVRVKNVRKATVTTAKSGSYYIRVRAFVLRSGKYYYSAWSAAEHVYTK